MVENSFENIIKTCIWWIMIYCGHITVYTNLLYSYCYRYLYSLVGSSGIHYNIMIIINKANKVKKKVDEGNMYPWTALGIVFWTGLGNLKAFCGVTQSTFKSGARHQNLRMHILSLYTHVNVNVLSWLKSWCWNNMENLRQFTVRILMLQQRWNFNVVSRLNCWRWKKHSMMINCWNVEAAKKK
jgi:hypothetical protein